MSMVSVATKFLQRTRKKEVTQTDLITYVVQKTGYSRESVRGSIIGYGNGNKLFAQPSFRSGWVVCTPDKTIGKRKRFVRRKYATASDVESTISYDTVEKKRARDRALSYLDPHAADAITLASSEGYCVSAMLEKCPDVRITNIERDPEVLDQWKSKGIPTNDYLGTLSKFIHSEEFLETEYDFLNADLMGYACGSLHKDLVHLNQTGNIKTIALTILGIKCCRNHGWWADMARKKYKSSDPTKQWIKDIMPNYRLIDSWFYTRDAKNNSRPMRMFILERST